MYKFSDKSRNNFLDFNQPMCLYMNPENRWIKMADAIPWDDFEKRYARLFKGKDGNVAKPLRMALGCLIIQSKYQYSDRELIEQLAENPYYQYFIGLPGYQDKAPIDASSLTRFRKRLKADVIAEANEIMLEKMDSKNQESTNEDDHDNTPTSGELSNQQQDHETMNKGTCIIDASCAPANIRYPQDISLLNESREKLETIIIRFCKTYGLPRPRMYRRNARRDYLSIAKLC